MLLKVIAAGYGPRTGIASFIIELEKKEIQTR